MVDPLATFDASLPAGVRSRRVDGVNGLSMHVLEAGRAGQPAVLLLHGFPELAYSWRRVLPALADAGLHAIAPDQRGYGLTTGWDADYDGDLMSFRMLNLARDALGLLDRLGVPSVAAVVGHDFGSPVAAWCALWRPDVFRSVVLMSAPFAGPPALPRAGEAAHDVHAELAALPRPRKHYQRYYGTRAADADMRHCPQGVHAFLRAYYHVKSADWPANRPYRLAAWNAASLAELPTYYVMDAHEDMPATVAHAMPTREQIDACSWLGDDELRVYSRTFERTGFQGGLQWYRAAASPRVAAELQLWSGRAIDVPAMFVAGRSDWGVYQRPGDFEAMATRGCSRLSGGCHLIDGAGHWVQQEQPDAVNRLLVDFLARAAR